MICPPLKTFWDQVVRESFELSITVLHLVVLSIENNRLLYLFYISFVKDVLADWKFLQTEIGFEGATNYVTSFFCDTTVENFKLNERHMVAQ